MANQFVNLPVPLSNTAGAAVDVSEMGATKTIVVGGPFKGTVDIEFATDDVGAGPWAPVPNASFVNQGGRVTADFAARWMRASMQRYQSGTPNADVGGSGAGSKFALLTSTPADISALPGLKTVVSSGAVIVEISLDGISWSQAFSLQNAGSQTAVVYGALARTNGPAVWMGGADNTDQGAPPYPQPPIEETIYARTTGSDVTGNGTLANPYRTFQRAIRDVPSVIPGGYTYTVDITGIGTEVLPPDYQIPAIFAPTSFNLTEEIGGTVPLPFSVGAAFNIRAFPQPASNIPLADTAVPAADVASETQDPYSNIVTITTLTPRASWAADALKGKFLLVEGSGFGSCVIQASTATTLVITRDFPTPGAALTIAECSATLETSVVEPSGTEAGIAVLNSPQIAYQGIRFTSTTGSSSLRHSGGSQPMMNLCDIDGIRVLLVAANFWCEATVIRNKLDMDGAAFTAYQCLVLGCDVFQAGTSGNVWYSTINDGCESMGNVPTYTTDGYGFPAVGWEIVDCWFTNIQPTVTFYGDTFDVGAIWANGGGSYSLQNVRFDSTVGPALTAQGSNSSFWLENVGGSTLTPPLRAIDGATIRIADDATDIADGGGFGMQVGALPPRTWADFRTALPGPAPSGRGIKNEYDLSLNVAGWPEGDEGVGLAGTGGRSGSRVFQRPV